MLVTGRRRGRWLGWKAEVVQNFLGRLGFLDSCEHAYRTATSFTYRNVDVENSRHQLGPAVIARMRLFFFGAVSMSAGFRVRRWRRDRNDGGALFHVLKR